MAMTHSRVKTRAVVALAAILTFAGAGAAFAYWTSSGTGTAEATTASDLGFVVETYEGSGSLAPGSPGRTVWIVVSNPTEGPLYFTGLSVDIAQPDGTPWIPPAGCLLGDYTATITTAPPAGEMSSTGWVDAQATVTLANTVENQDACKGQAVPLLFEAY